MRSIAMLVMLGVLVSCTVAGQATQAPPIGLELTTLLESDAAHPGTTFRMALEVRLNPGFHVQSNEPLDEFLIPTELELAPPAGIEVASLAFPQPVMLEQAGLELAVFEEESVIGIALDLAAELAAGNYRVPGTFRYQACDETVCYSPDSEPVEFAFTVVPSDRSLTTTNAEIFVGMVFDPVTSTPTAAMRDLPVVGEAADMVDRLGRFEVLATTGGYINAEDFLAFIEVAESGEAQRGLFEGRGPLAIAVLILIGGLALNLTPCVLPLVPVNLAIIGAGSHAGSRARGFALGAAYGSAMAFVYGVLGLVVVLTAGTFGTINASPWFNLGIAILFVALTLAMFDVVTIDFSRFQSKFGAGASGKGSFPVAFGMGGVAALLAGACVAPVVIQVIVFASNLYARGTALALALPFFLGVGMALPWPLVGAGLSLLPEPGPWMVRVKQAIGLFILTTAVYYGYLSYGLFAQYWVDPNEVTDSVQELLEEGWHASLSQGMAVAEAENKLVLVDVWATWCKNCLTMDKTTLKNADVQGALSDYVKVKFQAENLNVSPAREVMKRFEAIGLPAYAILRPGSGSQ